LGDETVLFGGLDSRADLKKLRCEGLDVNFEHVWFWVCLGWASP